MTKPPGKLCEVKKLDEQPAAASTQAPSREMEYLTKKLVGWTRIYTYVTAFALMIAALSAYISYKQAVVSQKQLQNLREGSQDTHNLAVAAEKQALALTITAKTTQDSYTSSSRAWIAPGTAIMAIPTLQEPFYLRGYFGNIGHSPAFVGYDSFLKLYYSGEFDQDFAKDVQSDIEECKKEKTDNVDSIGTIFPSEISSYYRDIDSRTYNKDNPQFVDEDFISGRKVLVFAQCYTYVVNGDTKHTYVCSKYQFGSNSKKINKKTKGSSTGEPADQALSLEACPYYGAFAD